MKTRALLSAIVLFTLLTNLFAKEKGSVDLSTPERAVQSLEAARRANDIEKAVRCKDFRGEAQQILRARPAALRTEDIIAQTAQVLETAYRAEIKKSGFPKMDGVTSTFIAKRELGSDRIELTQEFRLPDGSTRTEKVQVRRTKEGWKVITAP
jgi:hypothetical protein